MCGIAGIFGKHGATPDASVVQRMLTSMAHRGPDDEGLFADTTTVLGHRRLAIIDIGEAGHQPMHYKDYSIVFNGEIYNYLEIRKELISLGHTFATETDTEVILQAYEQWGSSCLERFIGMWAFVIVDKAQRTAFCARDRFGIKPFYYAEDNHQFIFASEIKALLAADVAARVDFEILLTYLVSGYENYSASTFFQGILQLMPAHCATIDLDTGAMSITRYYELASNCRSENDDDDDFDTILERSIRLHNRSDVPVGTCLSGGLDSSTLAALSSQIVANDGAHRFGAVTAQSESPHNDESSFARSVVEHCNLDWRLVKPTYDDFASNIEQCIRMQEEPGGGPSTFMQYCVMKKAKEAGFKVMLDGQGADEAFLGYERYYPAFFWHLFTRGHWRRLASEYRLASRHSRLNVLSLTRVTLYILLRRLRKRVLRRRVEFLKPEYTQQGLGIIDKVAHTYFDVTRMQISELTEFQLPHLLRYEDRNSMAHSIEARVPYVEHHLIESALSSPPTDKIKNGFTKHLLRKVADRVLPNSITWRRDKLGFEAPTDLWLDQHLPIMQEKTAESPLLSTICTETVELRTLPRNMQWRLYNIAVWEEQYNVQT